MKPEEIFKSAILDSSIPEAIKNHVNKARAIESHTFDHTYLEFLDEQIRLNARGNDWSQRLQVRRNHLEGYVDIELITGRIDLPNGDASVEIDPRSSSVVHWETYEYSAGASA